MGVGGFGGFGVGALPAREINRIQELKQRRALIPRAHGRVDDLLQIGALEPSDRDPAHVSIEVEAEGLEERIQLGLDLCEARLCPFALVHLVDGNDYVACAATANEHCVLAALAAALEASL